MRLFDSHLLLATGLVVGFVGCKTSSMETSDGKSLDNFARKDGDALTVNACHGSTPVNASLWTEKAIVLADEDKKYQTAITESLSALPPGLLELYFDLGGQIVFTKDAFSQCTKTSADQKRQLITDGVPEYVSCWIEVDDQQLPKIVVNTDPQMSSSKVGTVDGVDPVEADIRHSLVRIFGYVTSQIIAKLEPVSAQAEDFTYGSGDAKFAEDRTGLALDFLDDVAKNPKFDLGLHRDVLDNPDYVLSPDITRDQRWANPTKKMGYWYMSDSNKAYFSEFTFAEAFDSWYCDAAKTREVMKAEFPQTYLRFNNIAQRLEGSFASASAQPAVEAVKPTANDAAKESEAAPTSAAEENAALGLTGPLGWNYPVLSGIVERRRSGVGVFQANGPFRTLIRERRAAGIGIGQANGPLRRLGRAVFRGPIIANIVARRQAGEGVFQGRILNNIAARRAAGNGLLQGGIIRRLRGR